MDVFWFRLPKTAAPDNETMGVFEAGRLFVLIDRRDYWQCAFVFPKGRVEDIRDEGIYALGKRASAVGLARETGAGGACGWDGMKLAHLGRTASRDRM